MIRRDHGEIISAMNKSGPPIHSAACKTGRCRDLFKMRKRRAFCMPVNEYVSLIEISNEWKPHIFFLEREAAGLSLFHNCAVKDIDKRKGPHARCQVVY